MKAKHLSRSVLAAVALCGSQPSLAQFDYALSGFGTVGYATSNRPETYDRYINDRGTFMRDSVVGMQIDAKAFDDFGVTVQVKGAPATNKDSRYEVSVPWAFVSWRPINDSLLRFGKQRIPYYLYSESFDVGASYDFARLPIEMYSLAPSNDLVGVSFQHTWHLQDTELTLDGLYGRSNNDFRQWARDPIPGVQNPGAQFLRLTFKGGGLVLTYKHEDRLLRLGVSRATISPADHSQLPADFPFVNVATGTGYYQVSNAFPGPGIATSKSVTTTLFTLGASVALPGQVTAIGEFARVVSKGTTRLSPRGNRGYAALLRPIDRWTPYVHYAFLKSPHGQRDLYTAVNDNMVPPFIPGAAAINASQRVGADQNIAFNQSSWAAGASYSLTPTSKFKGEFLRTRVRSVSQLLDVAPGDTPRNKTINTWSLSYSVVFQ